jgi:hypothetical protein
VPIHPGKQTVAVRWNDERALGTVSRTPKVVLGVKASNVSVSYALPRDRWPLFLAGPVLGPAMLIWAIVVVLVALAILLGRFKQTPLRTVDWLLLFIGTSTVNAVGGILVAVWAFAVARRGKVENTGRWKAVNVVQVVLILLTAAALVSLVVTIPAGLLGSPNMRITGNASSSFAFNWYQDRCGGALARGLVVSLPIWVYRIVMLVWASWLAAMLPKWARWGWKCFTSGGIWRSRPKPPPLPYQQRKP